MNGMRFFGLRPNDVFSGTQEVEPEAPSEHYPAEEAIEPPGLPDEPLQAPPDLSYRGPQIDPMSFQTPQPPGQMPGMGGVAPDQAQGIPGLQGGLSQEELVNAIMSRLR